MQTQLPQNQPLQNYRFNGDMLVKMIKMTFETTPVEWPDMWVIDLTNPTEGQEWPQAAREAHSKRVIN